MKNNVFHTDFRLNGNSFDSKTDLLHFTEKYLNDVFLFLSDWFDDSDFVTVSTSGSTGKPKKIQLKKEFMVNSANATGHFFELNNGTTALLCLPVQYIAGKMMLVRAMVLGWHLDVVEANSFPLKEIEKNYDFSAMVPLQLYNSIDKIDKINKLIVGGGIVSNELRLKILDLPTKIFATYGMTETITHIAIKPLNNAAGWISDKDYFQTFDGVSIYKDIRDCLVINAPKVATNKIVTNDLVEIISKNQFKWLGRVDHIINSGGIKLIPEQIEEKLSKIIKQRFFVAGVPDTILGEKLVLVIEVRESRVKSQELRSKISNLKSLNKFEIPRSIYFIDQFIETETKKIQRKKTLDSMVL